MVPQNQKTHIDFVRTYNARFPEKLREANPDARFSIRCVREVGYCFDVIAKEKVII